MSRQSGFKRAFWSVLAIFILGWVNHTGIAKCQFALHAGAAAPAVFFFALVAAPGVGEMKTGKIVR